MNKGALVAMSWLLSVLHPGTGREDRLDGSRRASCGAVRVTCVTIGFTPLCWTKRSRAAHRSRFALLPKLYAGN